MKAIIARGPGQLTLEEVADPDVQPGSVLVRTRVTAVSAGTELRMLYGPRDEPAGFGPGWPVVGAFGYLASGDVVAVGSGVQGIAIGDRVACGTTWGAHQEILRVDAESVQPLPSGLGYLEGACAYWAVPPLSGILAGHPEYYDDAAVIGLGPLGLAAVQMLVPVCRQVFAIDRIRARSRLAEGFGAVAIDPAGDVAAEVRRLSPRRPGVVIQAAGSQGALELSLQIAREQGVVVNVGTLPKLTDFSLFWPMQLAGVRVVPIHRPPGEESSGSRLGRALRATLLPQVFDMVARNRLDVRRLCSLVVPADDGPRAMAFLHDHPDRALGIAFAWHDDEISGQSEAERAVWDSARQPESGEDTIVTAFSRKAAP